MLYACRSGGVGGEHLLQSVGCGSRLHRLQFRECHGHRPGVLAVCFQEIITVVIGVALLFLGIACAEQALADLRQLRVGQGCRRGARGADAVEHRALDAEHLVVGHAVHQA